MLQMYSAQSRILPAAQASIFLPVIPGPTRFMAAGGDTLRGEAADAETGSDDMLDGGAGADTLYGGPGGDTLIGGPDAGRHAACQAV